MTYVHITIENWIYIYILRKIIYTYIIYHLFLRVISKKIQIRYTTNPLVDDNIVQHSCYVSCVRLSRWGCFRGKISDKLFIRNLDCPYCFIPWPLSLRSTWFALFQRLTDYVHSRYLRNGNFYKVIFLFWHFCPAVQHFFHYLGCRVAGRYARRFW